jgi:ABC-type transport system involved in Fe-S cluster assembly fused permease/ATPase subunit
MRKKVLKCLWPYRFSFMIALGQVFVISMFEILKPWPFKDEPTSSVDAETEEAIMESLNQLMVGRTTFIIAHRLSTVREADLILVLRSGEIVERGNFAELVRAGGTFASLYWSQFGLKE